MGWSEITDQVVCNISKTRRAEELLIFYYPKGYLCTNALNNIRNFVLIEQGPRFKITYFVIPLCQSIWNWLLHQTESKTLYVYGSTGAGNIKAMITFGETFIGKTLIANTIDDLRNLETPEFKGLTFTNY